MAPPARITSTWQCPDLPMWVRVALYAIEHHGHPLGVGELRAQLDPTATAKTISRAIARAKRAGLLAHDSTSSALYTRVGR